MKLSLTSWSFPQCSLKEAAGIAKILDINAIDIGYFDNPALDKNEIISHPEETVEKIQKLDIKISCLYHLFGDDIVESNLSLEDRKGENVAQFENITQFCKKVSIGTIFLLPGIVNPGQNIQEALKKSAENLKKMVAIGEREGISVAVEPHVHSYIESPELALDLLDKVPGLQLILDYAHFVCMGFTQNQVDQLIPYTKQVHLRQGKPGYLQTALDNGVINFNAVLGKLAAYDFDGYLSVEYVHQTYMDNLYDDVLGETIKMRDLVKNWIDNRK